MTTRYLDRHDGAADLSTLLVAYLDRPDVIVLGLPRGGVIVAAEVARALDAPLDVYVVRKVGVPWQEELAMGAVAGGGTLVLNSELINELRLSQDDVDRIVTVNAPKSNGERSCIAPESRRPISTIARVIIVDRRPRDGRDRWRRQFARSGRTRPHQSPSPRRSEHARLPRGFASSLTMSSAP